MKKNKNIEQVKFPSDEKYDEGKINLSQIQIYDQYFEDDDPEKSKSAEKEYTPSNMEKEGMLDKFVVEEIEKIDKPENHILAQKSQEKIEGSDNLNDSEGKDAQNNKILDQAIDEESNIIEVEPTETRNLVD